MSIIKFNNYIQRKNGTSYRANEGDWLKAWCGKYRVLRSGNLFKYSEDYGLTYGTALNIGKPTDELWRTTIFPNGNVVICGSDWMVYSNDKLVSVTDCTILDSTGDPYVKHTPVDEDYPGTYFNHLDSMATDGKVWVLGNYGCSGKGANPTNMYYSLDFGITWKVFYTFGQSTNFSDDGTLYGGTGGALLGDPANEISCRHIHSIRYSQDGYFYAITGDNPTGINTTGEMHILKIHYNHATDTWTVTRLLNDANTKLQRYRGNGIVVKNGIVYFPGKSGIFKVAEADINDENEQTLIHITDTAYSFANRGNELYFTKQLTNEIYVSWDLGENWESFDLVDGTLASENPQFNGDEILYTTQKTVGTIFKYQ